MILDNMGVKINKDTKYEELRSTGSVGIALDRLEVLVGRLGMNNREQSIELLDRLDAVSSGMKDLESTSTHKTVRAQLDGIVARLRGEAQHFLRDLGGVRALQELRAQRQPPEEFTWWYLDSWLAERRKKSLRRSVTTAVIAVAVLVVLAIVYQVFLAPDPEVAARYGHEQTARDLLSTNEFEKALAETNLGLSYAPGDPSLLIMKGVILEALDEQSQAQEAYKLAQRGDLTDKDFLLNRGQAYIMAGMYAEALADTQAVLELDPNSAEAYLLSGQAYELQKDFTKALEHYEMASLLSEQANQPELTALARTRMAFLLQVINSSNLIQGLPTATP